MFNRMRIYTVHVRPDATGSRFRPVFVKEGFNFLAFIFLLLWTLYQRLWLVSVAIVLVNMLLFVLMDAHVLGVYSIAALHLGVHLIVGYHANDWLRSRLRRKGYVVSDISAADSFLRAQQRYLERYLMPNPLPRAGEG